MKLRLGIIAGLAVFSMITLISAQAWKELIFVMIFFPAIALLQVWIYSPGKKASKPAGTQSQAPKPAAQAEPPLSWSEVVARDQAAKANGQESARSQARAADKAPAPASVQRPAPKPAPDTAPPARNGAAGGDTALQELFRQKLAQGRPRDVIPEGHYMLSQWAALYSFKDAAACRARYMDELTAAGVSRTNAERLFAFECGIVQDFRKEFLMDPNYTKAWFFDLRQPVFPGGDKAQKRILKEQSLTLSEVCKAIDEAEWHFWNSHEYELSADVWAEIVNWRLGGKGGAFAAGQYFKMVAEATGVPLDQIKKYVNHEGAHLSKYKWG